MSATGLGFIRESGKRVWREELPDSDLELLRSTAGGDAHAFAALVDRHSAQLFRLAMWWSGNRADAEDVVQETFAGAFKGAAAFSGRSSVKTWLTRILMRQAAKIKARQRLRGQTLSLDVSNEGSHSGNGQFATGATTQVDQRIDLQAMIQTLPEEHREVIVLREVQGLSYEEMAQVLGIPVGTVESRLFRARAGLRQRLKEYA